MTKIIKLTKRILPLLLLFFILFLQPKSSAAQTKSFYWERFDVDITLLENGDMRIIETQTLSFSGAPFTYGYSTIYTGSNGNNDGITDISVRDENGSYKESSSNAERTFDVSRSSDEVDIYWYFEPTVGSRTFQFAYTVVGGIQVGSFEEGDGDQIFWKAIPADHPSWIESGKTTIHLPEGVQPQININTGDYLAAAYIDGEETDRVQVRVGDDGRTITYDLLSALSTDQQLEVRTQFPHGLLDIETPQWQKRAQQADLISLVVLVIALLALVGGPLLVLLLWYSRGRDPEMGIIVPEYITEPPNNLPPAVVGTLVDEKADMRDIISTLLDLSQRGYMTITEGQNNNFTFVRADKSADDLRPFEQRFLKDVFRGKEECSLNSLRYKFADKLPKLRKLLYEELVTDGLVPHSPETVRNSYGCFSFLVISAAVASFIAIPAVLGADIATAVCPSFAIGLTGIAFLIVSRYMPAKTQKGAETAAQWEAFKHYLQNIEEYRNLEEAGDIFEKYLAYATAFGLERTWIRKFTAVSTTPVPTWYHPYMYGGYHRGRRGQPSSMSGGGMSTPSLEGMSGSLTGGLEGMSKGLTRMLSSTNTIMKSTPPSTSSSGGRSSGGFSGGFSGGGFSSGGGGSRGFG